MVKFITVFGLFRRRRTPDPAAAGPAPLRADWLVVGVGNPGERYAATRHNVGFMALDSLAAQRGVELAAVPGVQAFVGVRDAVAFARPTTYMNESGEAVAPLAEVLGVEPGNVVVLHDELDLPPGIVRLRRGGSENGHNGLKSISDHLGTRDYLRVRIGIGRPPQGTAVPDWVLAPVEGDIAPQIDTAADAARLVTTRGLERAQNEIHARP